MPDAPSWSDLDAALDAALDLDGPDRDAFVTTLDSPLREALAPLLRDALREDTVLDDSRAALALLTRTAPVPPRPTATGERIGPYEIEALVGEGGMGRVYRARRADGAFEQTVAVKVVRTSLALAGGDVAARLRRERALLATLDHPGVARLLDGGETDDGVPYLVTEFVDGEPITVWADGHDLGVRDRVRLLVEVARAVDHAHRRFVVHRDLKPSNVLVTRRDGAPRPVVLDFGIAKLLRATEDEGSAAFPLTRTGLRLLTPAYAAPELYEPTATVTTAADVYGLGALLYELLTGRRPHDDDATPGPATTEPTRPSRLVTAGGGAAGAGRSDRERGGAVVGDTERAGPLKGGPPRPDPARWSKTLAGDLDTICLKALHPDPARRYASAAALAADLERHLDGLPVEARPDSVAYVAGRFIRRHRASVAAAAVAVLALVAGLTVSVVALSNEREARAEAEASATQAEEAADLLAGLFHMASPEYDKGREVTVAEAVAEGVGRVQAVESAPLRAYLLRVLGETYVQIGEPVMGDSLFQLALAIHGPDAAGEEPSRVRSDLLATRDALSDPEGVLALAGRLLHDHPDDPDITLRALWWTSRAHTDLGHHRRAVATAKRVDRLARTREPEHRVRALTLLGDALVAAGRHREAVPHLEEGVRVGVADFGMDNAWTAHALTSLGFARGMTGDVAGGEVDLRTAMAFQAERYGANRVGYTLASLAEIKLKARQFRQAAAIIDSAITMGVPIVSEDHQDIGDWLVLRAQAENGAGEYRAAEQTARRALAVAHLHPAARARALAQLGQALRSQGRPAEAGPYLREAQALRASLAAQAREAERQDLGTPTLATAGASR